MQVNQIYKKLKEAYTAENLNTITSQIIHWYKERDVESMRSLLAKLKGFVECDTRKANRMFSKLMMLYHPDRLGFYKGELEKYHTQNDIENLSRFSHILIVLDDGEFSASGIISDDDAAFPSDLGWGFNDEDFDSFTIRDGELLDNDLEAEMESEVHKTAIPIDFISALKRRDYGNVRMQISPGYLRSIEGELELPDYEIDDLLGIEYCTHITSLDLSNNRITDISRLKGLRLLRDMYLSGNQIHDIFILQKLTHLRMLDLSYNKIRDLNPIIGLPNLEYLNVYGNMIPSYQIKLLKKNGVTVVS